MNRASHFRALLPSKVLLRAMSTPPTSATPIEDAIRDKVRLLSPPPFPFHPTSTSLQSQNTPKANLNPLKKVTSNLHPTHLRIRNDSAAHAGHAAMRSQTAEPHARETHFHVEVVSDAFQGKPQPARHRLVYGLLREEMEAGGLHALGLVTRTAGEVERRGGGGGRKDE